MPTIRKYTDGSGYYVRANVDGDFLTLQLTTPAEGLLTDLGYSDGDSVSWTFLSPLCQSGDVYTNESGTEVSQTETEPLTEVSDSLTDEERARLEQFLDERQPTGPTMDAGSETAKTEDGEEIDPRSLVGEQARNFIERWSETEDEYVTTLNRIPRSGDPEGVVKSVRHHGVHHPIHPQGFEVDSNGVPVYVFETGEIRWTVSHFEPLDRPDPEESIRVEIRPGESDAQSIAIGPGVADWATNDGRLTTEQVDDFLAVVPDVQYFVEYHPSSLSGRVSETVQNPDVELSAADERRVQAVRALEGDEPEDSRCLGVVLSRSELGYGRLRAHTGRTFQYDADDVTRGAVTEGALVSFEAETEDRGPVADEIRVVDTDTTADPVRLLTEWPRLREASLVAVRRRVTNPDVDEGGGALQPRDGNPLSVELGGDNQTTLTVSVPRGVYWALQVTEDAPAETADEAIRGTLKQYIDGSVPDPVATTDTRRLRVTLSESLLAMVETAVDTAPDYDNAESFLAAALAARVDSDPQELSVRLSGGEYAALEHLATIRGQTLDDLVAAGVEIVLADAPELSPSQSRE